MDAQILTWIAAHRAPWLDTLMLGASVAGRAALVWLALALARAVARREARMAAWQVVAAVALVSLIANGVVKPLVDRDRPYSADAAAVEVVGARPADASFPSGHAATAFAGAYALSSAWPAGAAAWWAIAGLIAVSRVYLGVHYPSDVVAGALLGWLIGWFVVGGTRWARLRSR